MMFKRPPAQCRPGGKAGGEEDGDGLPEERSHGVPDLVGPRSVGSSILGGWWVPASAGSMVLVEMSLGSMQMMVALPKSLTHWACSSRLG